MTKASKQICENCKKLFNINELDMNNGRMLCRDCEEHDYSIDDDYEYE